MKAKANLEAIPTSMAPEVICGAIHGELQVKGWDRPEVVIRANTDDLNVEEQDDVVRLDCQGNCTVHLPYGATLQVESAHANASFKSLKDQLDIDEVRGSLSLREVASVQVERVHGMFSARGVSGDLHAGKVDGNVSLRDIQGDCRLEQVHGNLDLRNVEGEIQADVDGNVQLRLSVMTGADYQVQADGNLHCHIPEDASLRLILASDAETIRVRLPDDSQIYKQAECELVMGDGAAILKLSAGGSLYLFSQKATWTPADDQEFEGLSEEFNQQIAEQIDAQIQAQMAQMTQQLNEQMSQLSEKINQAGLSPQEAERIVKQALETSERETSRAQEKLRRAQQKLERKLETSRRRGPVTDRRTRAYGRGDWGLPPAPPQPPSPQVSEEERLMILRMLEQKKITPDEAEQLLSALEGRD